jgi:hypothetical protein
VTAQAPAGIARPALLLGVASAAALLLLHLGHVDSADSSVTFSVTRSIVEHGQFAIPQQLNAIPGHDGLFFSKYGIGLSALGVIPYLLAWPFAHLTGNPEDVEQFAVTALIPLISGALAGFLFALARRLGADARAALIAAVGAVIGTYLLAYAREFYTEPLIALCVVVAVERAVAGHRSQASAALALACITRPQMFPFALLFVLAVAHYDGRRSLRATVPWLVAAFAIDVAYNAVRFHKPFQFGYPGEHFTWHVISSTGTLLFDSRKSVILFAPIVLVTPFALAYLRRRSPLAFALLLGNALITIALTVTWHDATGGYCWGPRLLLPAVIPLIAAMAVWASADSRWLKIALALFAVGLLVNAPTIPVPPNAQDQLAPGHASPSLTRQWRLVPSSVSYDVSHLGTKRVPDPTTGQKRLPAIWQIGLVNELQAKGAALALVISALLAAVLAWAIVGLRREWPRTATPSPHSQS